MLFEMSGGILGTGPLHSVYCTTTRPACVVPIRSQRIKDTAWKVCQLPHRSAECTEGNHACPRIPHRNIVANKKRRLQEKNWLLVPPAATIWALPIGPWRSGMI